MGLLKENGVIGFIVPISFISTPRMSKIRQKMMKYLNNLYVLNYSDRPNCLFIGVHQKLSIIIDKKIPAIFIPAIINIGINQKEINYLMSF